MFQEMMPMTSGGGEIKKEEYSFNTSTTATQYTVSGLTNIECIFFSFDDYPEVVYGWAYKNGSYIKTYQSTTNVGLGITEVNDNTFTFVWNNILPVTAIVYGT